MRKLFINNIHIFLIILLVEVSFASNSFSQDDTTTNLREERQVLEQLNILKRNNIKQLPQKVPTNKVVVTPKKVLILPTETNTPTLVPTKEILPTKVILKEESQTTLEKDSFSDITAQNDIKKDEATMPQKTIKSPFPQRDINVVVNTPSQNVNNCIKENKQLEIANQKIQELSRELENKKRQLILVETEVERLSEVIEKRNRAQLTGGTTSNTVNQAPSNQHIQKQVIIPARKPYDDLEAEKADMPIAVVIVNKANLRAGPSLKDSPLLEVSKGTRLVVETRQGSWYRVMAPNGKRAWVSSDVVNFGATSSARPSFTTRIKGYSQDAEDRTESILR